MPALSVIICTHNPRDDYFGRTLDGLRCQTLLCEKWELAVIDNCSDQRVAGRFDTSWHPNARIIREEKLGLTPARLRGIREATCEVLVFVDDDNVLDPDYLEIALRTAQERPFLGSWSGQCRADFEATPPEWTRRYWGNLVIREFSDDKWSNLPRLAETMPCGAGLCVRRDVALHYLHLNESGKRSVQFDRTGTSLLSGGDNDLAACACDLGFGVGLVSALKLTHLISQGRLTEDYLARLAEGISFSSVLLDYDRGIVNPARSVAGQILDFLRIMRLRRPHRRIVKAAYRGRERAIAQIAAGTTTERSV
jgi:glycosyltransferase involved in cell wall biosynthesis